MTLALNIGVTDSGAGAPSATPARNGGRLAWLDVAKGIGMILVVGGHALGGIMDSPAGASSEAMRLLFLTIYLFHMPLFFFLSGPMVPGRVEKGQGRFLATILRTIAWPYFLWSVVQYSAIYMAGSLVNRPVEAFWGPLLNLPLMSISQFWFLYVLFFLHLAALILLPLLGRVGFLLLAVAARVGGAVLHLPVMPHLVLVHGLAYAVGCAAGPDGVGKVAGWISGRLWAMWLLVILAGAALFGGAAAIVDAQGSAFAHLSADRISALTGRAPFIPVAALAVLAVLAVSMRMSGPIAVLLGYVGRHAMTIFVLHVLFIAGTRILLGHLSHPGPWPMLLACWTIGLLAPLLVRHVLRRWVDTRLVGLG